ncbi:MAG: cation transporter [Micromonosporaceae bacterium]
MAEEGTPKATRSYAVEGMSCDHCVDAVTGEGIAGVSQVAVDLVANTVTVTGAELDDPAIRAAIDEAGYGVAGTS